MNSNGFHGFCSIPRSSPSYRYSSRQKRVWFPHVHHLKIISVRGLAPRYTPYANLSHALVYTIPPPPLIPAPPHWNWCPRAFPVYIKASRALLSLVIVVLSPICCRKRSTAHSSLCSPLHVLCLFLSLCCTCPCTPIGIRTTHRTSFVFVFMCHPPRIFFPGSRSHVILNHLPSPASFWYWSFLAYIC